MSIEVQNIGRLIAIAESSFGTDMSSSIVGSGVTIPAVEGSVTMEITQESIDPQALTAYKDKKLENVLGLKRATLSFRLPAISPGATSNNTAHTQNPLGFLLASVMGGEIKAEGHTVSGAWTSTYQYTASDTVANLSLDEGGAVGTTTSTGAVVWRGIDVASSSAIDFRVKVLTSGSPPNNSVQYGCSTYYLTEDPTTSLQFAVFGAESDDRWVLVGGQLESMGITTESGKIPMFEFKFSFASWLHGGASSLPSSYETGTALTGTLADYSYTGNNYVVNTGGEFLFITDTATYDGTQDLAISSDSYTCNLSYLPVPSPSGTQGISRWVRASKKPVMSGSFVLPYENTNMLIYKSSATASDRAVQLWRVIGGGAGGTMIIDCGTVQVTNVQRVDDNGLAFQKVDWEARHDSLTGTSSATGLSTSAFRIHFG